MKKIIIIITGIIVLVGSLPFLDIASKITWTTYLGIPLIILTGSAGVALITRRFEAIIGGAVVSALWPVLFEIMRSALSNH
jgi:uncharacterized MnhB-related membrane protein